MEMRWHYNKGIQLCALFISKEIQAIQNKLTVNPVLKNGKPTDNGDCNEVGKVIIAENVIPEWHRDHFPAVQLLEELL